MVKICNEEMYYFDGALLTKEEYDRSSLIVGSPKHTISYSVLNAHNVSGSDEKLQLKFDAMASHDITYVGIIQSAKASGLTEFPIPYALTNCHNSLCAVGGTINEDDHVFGLSAAKRYGGIYVPANVAVIHSYMREAFAGCGKMILGSDSHTRYGAIGTLAIGEGGPELVKQLLKRTYDINYPRIIAVELSGKVRKGVGPQDIALALIGEVFKNGFVKNAVLEFVGGGIADLSVEFRNGIDVMTTESACLSSVWCTDEKVKAYLEGYGRGGDYKPLAPENGAKYDGAVKIDLETVEPMIAMPFHPSNVYKLADVIEHPYEILKKTEDEGNRLLKLKKGAFKLTDKIGKDGKIHVSQGVIAGCAGGTYDNIMTAASILKGKKVGDGAFSLSVYPGSQPTNLQLVKNGAVAALLESGAVLKPCFCGPCFGAGDVPCNNGFSIRHTTRNFERREGSKPSDNQIASVALMDARSIAATAANGGVLTSALGLDYDDAFVPFEYSPSVYGARVFNGFGKSDSTIELVYGPNITDIPAIEPLKDNLAIKICSVINDPVTTTDELIPSGETSSYRSNPLRLAEFALSRKDPCYVPLSKAVRDGSNEDIKAAVEAAGVKGETSVGSAIFAVKPGDGSAREQAASCQRFLGGSANIAREYATKRYRSNLINWGMLPLLNKSDEFKLNDIIVIKDVRKSLEKGDFRFDASLVRDGKVSSLDIFMDAVTDSEKQIILDGCLINYYRN
jgi:aconitate hydratase